MTGLNNYVKRLDDIVKAAFDEYQSAKKDYEKAADLCCRTPLESSEYASIERELFTARENFDATAKRVRDAKSDIADLRNALTAAFKAEYLDAFDQLVDAYDRCIDNGSNVNEWDKLKGNILSRK